MGWFSKPGNPLAPAGFTRAAGIAPGKPIRSGQAPMYLPRGGGGD